MAALDQEAAYWDEDEQSASFIWRRGLASAISLIAAICLLALVFMVARSNSERDAALSRERHSYDVMVITRALDASMARSEAALGRFVIDGEPATGTIYFDEWKRAGRQIRQLARLTQDDPTQAPLVRELGHLYVQRGRELAVPASYANFRKGWSALGLFNQVGQSATVPGIARMLKEIAQNERETLGARSASAAVSAAWSNMLATLLSVMGVIFALGAIAFGWLSVQAFADRRKARHRATLEAERAETLEQAVTERTHALSEANNALRAEVATRAAAEAQLAQIQKMEAVGQLTGGIAHDFNNMLAVVVGGLDMARRRLSGDADEVARHIDSAMDGATRAAALTRRLLSFARAEPLLPAGVRPGQLIGGMAELLDRTLGERIRVETSGLNHDWSVWIDPHHLENAIVNLMVNARDAMDGEGTVRIDVADVTLREASLTQSPPGDYIRIAVSDEGCGMSKDVLDRVFEPFFTTKPVGKGTGLGLSQVFGFVRQSDGDVTIESTVGVGSTVSLYLPRAIGRGRQPVRPIEATAAALGDNATNDGDIPARLIDGAILVVEDDVRVRVSTVSALEELGFTALPCPSASEAIELLEARRDVALIVTDVVMPGMTGPEMIARIAPLYPEIGVLFVTGYVGEAGDASQFAGYEMLRKPFTVNNLAAAVQTALERSGRLAA